jgi:hypothetical protein
VISEFKADLESKASTPGRWFGLRSKERASGSGEDLHLDRVPIVFR